MPICPSMTRFDPSADILRAWFSVMCMWCMVIDSEEDMCFMSIFSRLSITTSMASPSACVYFMRGEVASSPFIMSIISGPLRERRITFLPFEIITCP